MERHPVSFMLDVQVWAVDVSAWHREPYTRPGASQVPALDARLVGAEDATRIGRYVRAIDRVRAFVACLLPRVMLVATQCVGALARCRNPADRERSALYECAAHRL